MDNIHWYEVCFWHDESDEAEDRACSFVVKTEIADRAQGEKAAPEILLRSFGPAAEEYRAHLTAVFEVDEDEARFFDVDDLTERVTDDLGTYYKRKEED